jgi:hypothetical protein
LRRKGALPILPTAWPVPKPLIALFGVLAVVLIVAVAIYSRSQDVKPSDEMRARRQQHDATAT